MSALDRATEITAEQAISILPDGFDVHTFRNPGGFMIGTDWHREQLIRAIRESDTIQLTGSLARSMGHGFAINCEGRVLFVETDEDRIAKLESELLESDK